MINELHIMIETYKDAIIVLQNHNKTVDIYLKELGKIA